MALASTCTATVEGVVAHTVAVEANIGPGLPGMFIVGLGDATVRESRDRIKTAVVNSQLPWPRTKIMVSLSPANLPKSGSHFDLPIALAVLAATDPTAWERLSGAVVAGELGLDGSLRQIDGVLPMLINARNNGASSVVIPAGNATEAALLDDHSVLVAHSLTEAWHWAMGLVDLDCAVDVAATSPAAPPRLDFADIAGQAGAKKALEVAAAGGHHVLMVGPPGSGKSMLAQRLPSILPELSAADMVEATAIHSVTGAARGEIVTHAPFVAPHPSVTRAALLGGGSGRALPGAVSLAHHGVLFLDEASEIAADVMDGLRIPLEEGTVRLVRARREIVFPARFQLVMATNPCRCGAEEPTACRCTSRERQRYLANISGPLRDRIDIGIEMSGIGAMLHDDTAESSATIADRVRSARDRAAHRWAAAEMPARTNSDIGSAYLRRFHPADDAGMALLRAFLADGTVSQRGVDRTLKLAWTLADLEGATAPNLDHVARATELRTTIGGAA